MKKIEQIYLNFTLGSWSLIPKKEPYERAEFDDGISRRKVIGTGTIYSWLFVTIRIEKSL